MTVPPFNRLLPDRPLLGRGTVQGLEVETLADPFLISHSGRLYLLAEAIGLGPTSDFFKRITVFLIDEKLQRATWLGDACPGDDGACSFPFTIRDDDRFLMVPEVFVPLQGGGQSSLQVLQIWETLAGEFPFGWRKIHEGILAGCLAPSDKVLFKHEDLWWLFCSDNAGRRLLAYHSSDLGTWRPHPCNPVIARDVPAPGAVPGGPRPWRLGGGPLRAGGQLSLPLQHRHLGGTYGGAVTLLRIEDLDGDTMEVSLDPAPILAEDAERPWMARGAHHVSLARHGERTVVATDGFDGARWACAVVELPTGLDLEPFP